MTRAQAVRIAELALRAVEQTHKLPDEESGAVGPDAEAVRWAAEAQTSLRRFSKPQVTPLALRDGDGESKYVH